MTKPAEFDAFKHLSCALGSDPLQVQGPGGNTSIKDGDVMWIKASGTELAEALERDIFVAVDAAAARAEVAGQGDGSCKDTVLEPSLGLRPSIETTFHAALDWPVVAHTHSVATLCHAISPQGCVVAEEKLAGLPFAMVGYAKPGLPLTRKILAAAGPETRVFVLQNHGLLCTGPDVASVEALIQEVEARLAMPVVSGGKTVPDTPAPPGFEWAPESWLARDDRARTLALSGSYYPDHVVFLGPALPTADFDGNRPAFVLPGQGVARRIGATSSQRAMLQCLSDVLCRLPAEWTPDPIGREAEAELLDWDAEKYRQALAARA